MSPQEQRTALAGEGFVFWNETMLLSPSGTSGASAFAASTLRRLEGRRRAAFLTLEGSVGSARVLPTLLRQLDSEGFVVSVPLETVL